MVALLAMGSAILLISCGGNKNAVEVNEETMISRTVEDMELLSSRNGKKTQLFTAPLMEDYGFAKAAFQEYRKGIEVVGFNDSTGLESSRIVADYALYWTDRDLWELKGNVLVVGEEGQRLFSQQLTWDKKIAKIYSNVDSKVEEGDDVFIGEGFEADDDFERWTFRKLKGMVSVEVEPEDETEESDAPSAQNTPLP